MFHVLDSSELSRIRSSDIDYLVVTRNCRDVSVGAVRNQLSLGTLKIARVHGLKLSRRFSMAYPAGPEPTGIVGIFRTFLLDQAIEMAPKRKARTNAS
jgi:LysR family transcriptional regulator, transcriptional activator of the cysJI operon